MKRLIPILALSLVQAALVPMRTAAQSYTPIDILPPDEGSFEPYGLTDTGQVPGMYRPPRGPGLPAVWQNGQMTLLPLLPGAYYGYARSGNSLGHLVGACRRLETNGINTSHACVWTNGVVQALPDVPGTDQSSAWAINDADTIAGNVYSAGPSGSFREAVVWNGNSVAKLQPPVAGDQTWARAINSSGQVAVSWAGPEVADPYWEWNSKPARWTPDLPNCITGTLTPLSGSMSATDINDAGVISGKGSTYLAAILDGLTEIPIDEPLNPYRPEGYPVYSYGFARGINNAGVAVGIYYDTDLDSTAWVWDIQTGTWNLNWILNGTSAYGYPGNLEEAVAINDAGQILVRTHGDYQYVLLTPSLPPPSLTIRLTSSNTVAVSWPSPSSGFVLQQNTNGVSSVNWSDVTEAIQDDGTAKTFTVNPTNSSRIYRLIHP